MTDASEVESLTDFIDRQGDSDWTAQIINRKAPEKLGDMIEDLFGSLSIDVTEEEISEVDEDVFLLLKDGEVVKSSPIQTLRDTLLTVNSDLYITESKPIEEIDPPDVITRLSDTVFRLQGYPESNTEKLVLTLMSRYIEHKAWKNGSGKIRTSFQRLSRTRDEEGTRRVYERLTETDGLETHIYGVPDDEPPESVAECCEVHAISDEEIRRHWFVVYRSESEDGQSLCLLARDLGSNEWEGFWTFNEETIREIDEYIDETF